MNIKELLEKLDFILNDKISINEMANIRKNKTGLPMNICLPVRDTEKEYKHKTPRIKFQNDTGDKINKNLVPISISDNPEILVFKKFALSNKAYEQLISWIKLNKDVLLKYWNQEIDDDQLSQQIKRIE